MKTRHLCVLFSCIFASSGHASEPAYLTTKTPVRLLSANDGWTVQLVDERGIVDDAKQVHDSITVIDLGPDHPPRTRTVYDTVPNSIFGAPHMAISASGQKGFVTNHSWRIGDPLALSTGQSTLPKDRQNVLTVIDCESPTLKVVEQLQLPALPWMVLNHPNGKDIIVCCGGSFRVFDTTKAKLVLKKENVSPVFIVSFAISPKGDRIIATAIQNEDLSAERPKSQIHVFSLDGASIHYSHRVTIAEELGQIDDPFAPRFSPDGSRVLVVNGGGNLDKGRLDDVLSIDMTLKRPAVTEVVRQVGDGLESVAFHPSGHMAVVTCLGSVISATPGHARLAVIDLASSPMRLLSQTPVEATPEGIEFTPEGDKLFVQCTSAHHVAVFDVSGYRLSRNQFVLPTGHGPASMAIWSQR